MGGARFGFSRVTILARSVYEIFEGNLIELMMVYPFIINRLTSECGFRNFTSGLA